MCWNEVDAIKVCVAYELDGEPMRRAAGKCRCLCSLSAHLQDHAGLEAIDGSLPISRRLARRLRWTYLKFLAELMDVPIAIVSLGRKPRSDHHRRGPHIHGPKRALLYRKRWATSRLTHRLQVFV